MFWLGFSGIITDAGMGLAAQNFLGILDSAHLDMCLTPGGTRVSLKSALYYSNRHAYVRVDSALLPSISPTRHWTVMLFVIRLHAGSVREGQDRDWVDANFGMPFLPQTDLNVQCLVLEIFHGPKVSENQ